jgi:homoserine kinase
MSEARTARIRIPGSSANVGAGFDCIGFAVDRWLSASVTASLDSGRDAPEVTIRRDGTLAALTLRAADDAVVVGFTAACRARSRALPRRLDFHVDSEIPVSRGLGASTAALVAGASLANVTLELGLDRRALAELCTELEGHPDNVAPSVFGGAVLGVSEERNGSRHWVFAPIEPHASLAFAFVVPPIPVETAAARAILPREIPHTVAVQAAGKAAALAHGLVTGDAALLRVALDDVLHVPYRRHLVPGYTDVVSAACAAGASGATLSGSGSTMLAISSHDDVEGVARAMRKAFADRGVAAESFVQHGTITVDHAS